MSAIRVARGYTGRDKVIKMAGCYHGHVDSLLAEAGSGVATFSVPECIGIPADFTRHTLVVPFNDTDAVRAMIEANPDQIACLILEPIAGNMGVIPPRDGYLQELREITAEHGILLIFDEVITGFRVAYGGAQSLYGVHTRYDLPRQDHRWGECQSVLTEEKKRLWKASPHSATSTKRGRYRAIRLRCLPESQC